MVLDGEIFLAISFQESTSDIASTYNLGCGAGWNCSTPAGILSEKGWESEREAVGEESVGRRTTLWARCWHAFTRVGRSYTGKIPQVDKYKYAITLT